MSTELDLPERQPRQTVATFSNHRVHDTRKRDRFMNAEAQNEVNYVLGSSGRPMEPQIRGFMESRFGHDFSRIKIHDDMRASESAQMIDARAYTAGEHIVFQRGQYEPQTETGRRLIAHELSHTIQQRGAIVGSEEKNRFSSEGSSEREASSTADNILHDRPFALRVKKPVGIALQSMNSQDQMTTQEANKIGFRSWSLKYHCPRDAMANAAFFELKNLATGHSKQLMFMGEGPSPDTPDSGPGPFGKAAKDFETAKPVNFNDFDRARGKFASAGDGGKLATYINIWNADGDLVTGLSLHGFRDMAVPVAGTRMGFFKLI
jgi:hypothetical protein